MTTGVRQQGQRAYEIDFLDFNYLIFPLFLSNLTAAETWLAGMADAALDLSLPVQFVPC